MIVAPIEDFSSGGFWENRGEGGGGDGKEALGLAAEWQARGGDEGAERGVAGKDERAEVGGEGLEEDLDQAVFDRGAGGGGVEGDLAEVVATGVAGLEDGEGDGVAVEGGEFRGHVVVVDEEAVGGLRDFNCRDPGERRRAEEGGGKEG